MPENLVKLLKAVFLIDPEAGRKLQSIFIKALLCDVYAKRIDFSSKATSLTFVFVWACTPEGGYYWSNIATKLENAGHPILAYSNHKKLKKTHSLRQL